MRAFLRRVAGRTERRYGAIVDVDVESCLAARGIRVVKVMLHIGSDEQKGRLWERLDSPDKHWKHHQGDVHARALWDNYLTANQIAFERTSTRHLVPASCKWSARLAVQGLLLDALEGIDPHRPAAGYDVEAEKARLAAS